MKPKSMAAGAFLPQTIAASVRTFLLLGSLAVASAPVAAVVQAQPPPDIPPPSDIVYEVRLADGSVIVARIAELDDEQVVLTTPGGGRVEIGRAQIRAIRVARGRIVEGELWHEDPSGARLFVAPTGRALRQGEWRAGTYLVSFIIPVPSAAVGITDRISVSAGAPFTWGRSEPFYLAPRMQVLRTPRVQAALGTLVLFDDDDEAGIAYGVGTFGDRDKAVSAGLGFFYSGDEVRNKPAFMLGGETRVGRRIKLMTENYRLPDAVGVVISGGIRFIGEHSSTEIGLIATADSDGGTCCFLLFNISYAFGRR